MSRLLISKLVYILITTSVTSVHSECRQSFVTICDNFKDFTKYPDVENLSEVMIGSHDGTTNMTSVDLMDTLNLQQYHRLTTLMVVRAVNKLEHRSYAYQCTYRDSPLTNFIFYGNELKTLESYIFPVVNLRKMSLVNNQIEAVKRWTFRSHPIVNLDLSDNLLEVIESDSLPLNDASKIVTIRNNKITHIETGSFHPTLERLNLDKNKLRYVQDEVFEPLVNLKELTLSHNSFNSIPKIDHMNQMVIFDISHNAIATIKKGTFSNMDNLKFLDLSNNRIDTATVLEWVNTPGKQPELTVSLVLNRLRDLELDQVDLQTQKFILYGNPWDCSTWPRLKIKLKGHENECDSKFQSSGSLPYCINYESGGYNFPSQWERDISEFRETIRKREKRIKCASTTKRNYLLKRIEWGCVE